MSKAYEENEKLQINKIEREENYYLCNNSNFLTSKSLAFNIKPRARVRKHSLDNLGKSFIPDEVILSKSDKKLSSNIAKSLPESCVMTSKNFLDEIHLGVVDGIATKELILNKNSEKPPRKFALANSDEFLFVVEDETENHKNSQKADANKHKPKKKKKKKTKKVIKNDIKEDNSTDESDLELSDDDSKRKPNLNFNAIRITNQNQFNLTNSPSCRSLQSKLASNKIENSDVEEIIFTSSSPIQLRKTKVSNSSYYKKKNRPEPIKVPNLEMIEEMEEPFSNIAIGFGHFCAMRKKSKEEKLDTILDKLKDLQIKMASNEGLNKVSAGLKFSFEFIKIIYCFTF